jgi:hypothetical protein
MKPTTTVAEFIRQGREAGQDALGIAHDPEAAVAIATVHRERFLRDRDEASLRRWRALVAEVANGADADPSLTRWLGVEHVRLGRGFADARLTDPTLTADTARWAASVPVGERDDIVARFELDLAAPITAVAVGSRG